MVIVLFVVLVIYFLPSVIKNYLNLYKYIKENFPKKEKDYIKDLVIDNKQEEKIIDDNYDKDIWG